MRITYPCFRVEQDSRGFWRWSYYPENVRALAVSNVGYETQSECQRSIEVMKEAANATVFPLETGNLRHGGHG